MSGKYNYLWNKLKTDLFVQVEFPRSEHNKILRLLRRESFMDGGFRFRCSESDQTCRIQFNQVGDILYLRLMFFPKIRKKIKRG